LSVKVDGQRAVKRARNPVNADGATGASGASADDGQRGVQ
jgi:hypothetical protein